MKKGKVAFDDRSVMIVLLAFLLLVIFVSDAMKNPGKAEDADELFDGGMMVVESERGEVPFVVNGEIDEEKLHQFANMDYEEMKRELDVDEDFVIYFEDEDGEIIPIEGKYCIGSGKAKVAGIPCG